MAATHVIVDYGMGNLWSVQSALRYLGAEPVVSGEPKAVALADTLILPGVGSFFKAMETLNGSRLTDALKEAVLGRGRKILGICLGMQLMAEQGTEDGSIAGLGFFPGTVERFEQSQLGRLKIPHVGFNSVTSEPGSRLFAALEREADFYFVHSYRLLPQDRPGLSAFGRYGSEFLAAYEHENVFCTQFHPEKSQTNGLKLLRDFLAA